VIPNVCDTNSLTTFYVVKKLDFEFNCCTLEAEWGSGYQCVCMMIHTIHKSALYDDIHYRFKDDHMMIYIIQDVLEVLAKLK
jgi:hypothetical protein